MKIYAESPSCFSGIFGYFTSSPSLYDPFSDDIIDALSYSLPVISQSYEPQKIGGIMSYLND